MMLLLTAPLAAEYVFLRDGAILKGTVTADSAASITLRLEDGTIRKINRPEITRLMYTELYMGKVHVQKTDGTGIVCYQVDEDRDTYTFRKELYSPAEFKLNRDEVLFMARGNPTGLSAAAGTVKADLKWNAPYMPVKGYRIYLRGPGEKEFARAGDTGSKSFTLKNIKSNTKYTARVTAVDSAGDETMPSNAVNFETKNIPPGPPRGVTVKNSEPSADELFDTEVNWQPAVDPDGKVAGYEIWSAGPEKKLMAAVKESPFIIKKLAAAEVHRFTIRSIDDKGGFSETAGFTAAQFMPWRTSARVSAYMPCGEMGDKLSAGFGLSASVEYSIPIYKPLYIGLETGAVWFTGARPGVEGMLMIPLEVRTSYIYVHEKWSFIGSFNLGAAFSSLTYSPENNIKGDPVIKQARAFDPSAAAAIHCLWALDDKFSIGLTFDVRMVFETEGALITPGGGISCAYTF
jgi:hypothetical protein